MPFTLDAFIARRPFLYHFTAIENLDSIRYLARLDSAAILAGKGNFSGPIEKREKAEPLSMMPDLLARLSSLVFFWPGDDTGPIPYGRRHRIGNKWPSNAAALRIPSRELFESLKPNPIFFCPYNSGSPRWSGGQASPRGPHTFLSACDFPGTPCTVVEVVVKDSVKLPGGTKVSVDDSWELLPV